MTNRITRIRALQAALLAGTCLFAPPALAAPDPALPAGRTVQESQPAPSNQAGATTAAGDIVVTARKERETVSRTPVAVSAMSGADLKRLGVNSLDNLGLVAPNVVINRGTGQSGIDIVLRGVQDNGQGQAQTPGIAVLIDNIQQLDTRALIVPFFDIDHIEVLRGPQGTLYGAASPGGVVKVISARPQDTFGGSADVELGNYDTKRGNFVLNTPITDTISTRVAASFNDRDGYLLQKSRPGLIFGGGNGGSSVPAGGGTKEDAEHDWSVRGSIMWRPSSETSWLLSATAQHSYNSPYSSVPFTDFISADHGASQRSAPANPIMPDTNDWFYTVNSDLNTRVGPVAADLTLGYSYITFNDIIVDNGGTNPPGGPGWIYVPIAGQDKTYSAELRLHNAESHRFEWTAGASYIGVRSLIKGYGSLLGAPCLGPDVGQPGNTDGNSCLDGVGGNTNPTAAQSQVNDYSTSTIRRNSTGLYGTLQYHITPTLEATGGARVSFDDITQDSQTFKFLTYPTFEPFGTPGSTYYGDPCTGINYTTPLCSGTAGYQSPGFSSGTPGAYGDVDSKLTYKGTKFTWKAGLDWKPNSTAMLYANVATGYKPGGFNPPSGYATAPCCYKAENLMAFEVGYKGRPLPWLYLDSDAFYYDYKDQQIVSSIEIGNANFISTTINTPTRAWGLENQAIISPTRQDTLTLGVNYLHTEFVDLLAGGNAGIPLTSWAGHVLDKSPKWTLSINWKHRFDLGDRGSITFNVGTQYTSEYFLDVISNTQTYRQAPFTKTNADVTWTGPNGKIYVQAFVHNLEDRVEETQYGGKPSTLGDGNVGISEPRFFGMRLGAKF